MLKSILNVLNRAQTEAKKDMIREERRRRTLVNDLGLSSIFEEVEDRKRDWEKEDKREEAIRSFLDLWSVIQLEHPAWKEPGFFSYDFCFINLSSTSGFSHICAST